MLEIKLCGEPQVRYDGKPWKIRVTSPCWSLLALLTMQRQPLARASVAPMLWPDALDSEALANLRRHLHVLVKALPPSDDPWIVTDAKTMAWNSAIPSRVDVVEFERLLAQGRDDEAVDLYSGDLLESSFDEAIVEERERLRASYLRTVERLMSAARASGDLDGALRYAELLLAADEWREDALRAVMAIRYEKGDRSGALATYERFAEALRRELRVQPMNETTAMRDTILAGEPLTGGVRLRSDDANVKLIGRAEELRSLRTAWTRAARGRGATILLGGEPGIGKSRLAVELCALVEEQRGSALIGRTSSPETAAFQPVIEALREGLGLLSPGDVEDAWLAPLARVLPEIERLRTGELPSMDSFGAEGARARMREALLRLAAAMARRRPLVIVLEDLHWADSDTLELVEMLANRAAALPLLLVLTYRSGELGSSHRLQTMRRELQHGRRGQTIALARLDESELGELAEALAVRPDAAFVKRLRDISEGNPLFAVQILRHYSDTGKMPEGDDALASVAGTVLSRLDKLSKQARAIADVAASIGGDFTIEEVARIGGWEEAAVLDAFASLLDGKIICERGGDRFAYGFTHALIEAAIRDAVPAGDDRMRHFQIAEVLTSTREREPASASLVALHWEEAGQCERAAAAWLQAAGVAMQRFAWSESVRLARRAIALGLEGAPRYEALAAIIAASLRLAEAPSVAQEVGEIEAIAATLGTEERLRALLLRAQFSDMIDDREGQRFAADAMLEAADAAGSDRWRAEAHLERARLEYRQGRVAVAQAESAMGVELARSTGIAELTWRARELQIQHLLRLGNVDEGRAQAEAIRAEAEAGDLRAREALVIALVRLATATQDSKTYQLAREWGQRVDEEVGDVRISLVWRNELAYEFQQQWDTAAARASFEEASALTQQRGLHLYWMVSRINLGCVEREIGNFDRARALWLEVRPTAKRLNVLTTLACAAMNLAELELALGRPENALEEARESASLAAQCGVLAYQAEAANVLGAIECALGKTQEGLARMRDGLKIRRTLSSPRQLANELSAYVEALVAAGHVEDATLASAELRALFDKYPNHQVSPARIALALAAVARANGCDAEAQKTIERGRRAVEHALSRLTEPSDRAAFAAIAHNRTILG